METVSGIIGVVCLGFAAIATFLLVPDRELKPRERIGMHTIFWTFILYAVWIIYSVLGKEQGWNALDKFFYISFPVLLGLLLSLLAELGSKQPPFNISDSRVKRIAVDTWRRLPNNVRRGLYRTVMNIQSIPEWSDLDRETVKPNEVSAAKWYPILPFPARGIIHISVADCKDLPDRVIAGTLARELALAYQSTHTPFDTDTINKAADSLPVKWGFKKELEALGNRN
jgi:hypothetical protein